MASSTDDEYNMSQKFPENPTDYLQVNSDSDKESQSILRAKKNAEKPANDSDAQKSKKKSSSHPPAKRVCFFQESDDDDDDDDDEDPTLFILKSNRKVPDPAYKRGSTTACVLLKAPKELRLEKLSSVIVNTGLSATVPSDYTCVISTPKHLAEKCGVHVISSSIPWHRTDTVTVELYNVSDRMVIIPAGKAVASLSVYKCVIKLEMEILSQ